MCNFEGNLGHIFLVHLWQASGCGRGSGTNETAPPEDREVQAHACTSASDLDIL